MALNGKKFELLGYGDEHEIIQTMHYSIKGKVIMETNHVKDLGMHMSNASLTHHYSKTIDAAKKMTNWVLRTFQTRQQKCMLILWKTMVQPK
ncbi:hypothetical protein E2C01_046913 [Portunus trituberculatus]|uniref:Uncharacterized protein n=1 Tax=Portunus trituberculatus TaxID=210409 RepID=A0A5B7G622_PORTR|nr:hypothetical protein [Portunus trituberculatus]